MGIIFVRAHHCTWLKNKYTHLLNIVYDIKGYKKQSEIIERAISPSLCVFF